MPKFRKKPVVIEAVLYEGAVGKLPPEFRGAIARTDSNRSAFIDTLEGTRECRPGDWIIRGVAGKFYPVKPDIFAATYEPAICRICLRAT